MFNGLVIWVIQKYSTMQHEDWLFNIDKLMLY